MGGVQSKKLTKKLENREVEKITTLFNDISSNVKGNKVVDRDGFKRFHLIPGPLSDRLFNMCDPKKNGMITQSDFIDALAVCGKAPEKEKLSLIFKFMDLDDDDQITKEEISVLSVVSLESSSSPKVTAVESRSPAPPSNENNDNPYIKQLIELGFTKLKVIQAIKATENGTKGDGQSPIDIITNWILTNQTKEDEIDIDDTTSASNGQSTVSSPPPQSSKPDPQTLDELTVGLALSTILSTFENLFPIIDGKENTGKISSKQFKKWAAASKRPAELDNLLKPVTGLYDRALKWKQSGSTQSVEGLERSLSSTSISSTSSTPAVAAAIPDPNNPKELKRFSSVSVIDSMKQKDKEKEKEKEKEKASQTLSKKDGKKVSASSSSSSLNNTSTASLGKKDEKKKEKEKEKEKDKGTLATTNDDIPPPSNINPPTTTTTTNTSSSNIDPGKHSQLASSSSSVSSDFSDSDDDHTIKPAIQVVIRDKPIDNPELKKANSLFNIDTPGLMKPTVSTNTLRSRGTRHSISTRASVIFDGNNDIFNQPLTPLPYTSAGSSITGSGGIKSPPSIKSPPTQSMDSLDLMKKCIDKFENGHFTESMKSLDLCIQSILSSNSSTKQNEVIFLVGYGMAIKLLQSISVLDGHLDGEKNEDERMVLLEKLALQSRLLVGIPVQKHHRLLFAKMATRYNFEAKNYGITNALIDCINNVLSPSSFNSSTSSNSSSSSSNSSDRIALDKIKKICLDQQLYNESLQLYVCPTCKTSLPNDNSTSCSCGRPIKWCYSTLQLIQDLTCLQCNFCQATYSISQPDIIPKSTCPSCQHGSIVHK